MLGASAIRIPRDLAQGVADAAMTDVAYNVNIIDADGVILASGDSSRVGTVHHGALRAIESGEAVEVAEDTAGQRTGINLPFALNGQTIGVVGITGPLTEVRPLARLVRTSVSLLVQQNLEFTRQRYEVLTAALAAEVETYAPGLVELAMMQGLDLTHPQTAVLVVGDVEGLPRLWPAAFALPGGEFLVNPDERDDAVARWIRHVPDALFFVSEPHDLAWRCLAEVRLARSVQRALDMPGSVHQASDVAELIALRQAPRRTALAALDNQPELVETLRTFITHNMGMSETAAALHVHRNTLLYRLQRIRRLTGLDPRQLLELVALVGYVLHLVDGPSPS